MSGVRQRFRRASTTARRKWLERASHFLCRFREAGRPGQPRHLCVGFRPMAKSMSLGTVGLGCSFLLCAVAATSCGGAQGSDDGGDEGGSSGSGATTGGSTTGGSSTGGSATGGTAGSATGGTGGSLCAPSGNEPVPPGGEDLASDDCMPNPTPQTCSGSTPNGHMPPDGVLIRWDTYVVASGNWGNSTVGDLTGGTSKYNGRDVMPISVAVDCGELRLTATIPP